jgi:hypothetical protein
MIAGEESARSPFSSITHHLLRGPPLTRMTPGYVYLDDRRVTRVGAAGLGSAAPWTRRPRIRAL